MCGLDKRPVNVYRPLFNLKTEAQSVIWLRMIAQKSWIRADGFVRCGQILTMMRLANRIIHADGMYSKHSISEGDKSLSVDL